MTMYPYQRTPMGNPYISPISRGYLWVSYPQESLENTTGWWLNHPFEKYARQIASFPQFSGKIGENKKPLKPPPRQEIPPFHATLANRTGRSKYLELLNSTPVRGGLKQQVGKCA